MAEHRWRVKAKEDHAPSAMDGKVLGSNKSARHSSTRRAKSSSCSKSAEFRKPLGDTNSRLTQSEDHTPSYVWRCPGEPLTERRSRAERRREELLHVIYEENMAAGHIEDLVSEWVALVVERDQLLREQLNQENRCLYFRELQHLLREQPPLGDDSEEANIRETLLDLERYVTRYCHKHNVVMTPQRPHLLSSQVYSKPQSFQSPQLAHRPGIAAHPTSSAPAYQCSPYPSGDERSNTTKVHLEFYEHKAHILDQETGQTGVAIREHCDKENSNSSGSLFKEAKARTVGSQHESQVPVSEQFGKEYLPEKARRSHLHGTGASNVRSAPLTSHSSPYKQHLGPVSRKTLNHVPPVSSTSPPPLPTSPPFALPVPPLPQLPVGVYGKGGVSGTVQFAGMSYTTSMLDQAGGVVKDRCRDGESTANQASSDKEEMTETLAQEDRKNLLLEISTVGQSALKPTNRPRSPGGTPIRPPNSEGAATSEDNRAMISMNSPGYNHQQQLRNTDLLQKALLAKFRSLHSTPIKQKGGTRQLDYSNSFDFSSAWSDINSSVQMFEDPDITNTSHSVSAVSPGHASKTANKTTNKHNGSTAV